MAARPGTTYRSLRATIQQEKDDRIRAHRARIAGAQRMVTALGAGQPSRLNVIAQGDSWFDYPLPVPILDQSDVIAHLQQLPGISPEFLSVAHHGETAEDMLGVKKIHDLFDNFGNPANGKFDAILSSGGGSDLAGNQFRLWLNAAASSVNPASGLNPGRVASMLG